MADKRYIVVVSVLCGILITEPSPRAKFTTPGWYELYLSRYLLLSALGLRGAPEEVLRSNSQPIIDKLIAAIQAYPIGLLPPDCPAISPKSSVLLDPSEISPNVVLDRLENIPL